MNGFTLVVSFTLLLPLLVAKYVQFQEWMFLLPVAAVSGVAYCLTDTLIPSIKLMTASAGLAGRDLSKVSTEKM